MMAISWCGFSVDFNWNFGVGCAPVCLRSRHEYNTESSHNVAVRVTVETNHPWRSSTWNQMAASLNHSQSGRSTVDNRRHCEQTNNRISTKYGRAEITALTPLSREGCSYIISHYSSGSTWLENYSFFQTTVPLFLCLRGHR